MFNTTTTDDTNIRRRWYPGGTWCSGSSSSLPTHQVRPSVTECVWLPQTLLGALDKASAVIDALSDGRTADDGDKMRRLCEEFVHDVRESEKVYMEVSERQAESIPVRFDNAVEFLGTALPAASPPSPSSSR